jgi:uncharacterized protein YndB with AHSA1/START domain
MKNQAAEISRKTEFLVIERKIKAPIARVWQAISDNNEMKHWYFKLEDFKPEVGFEFQFLGGTETKQYLHLCKVVEVINGKKLAYSWRYDGYPGNSYVTFELFEKGNETKLRLTHEGLETFPKEDVNFARESFAAGWTQIIGTNLKEYVEKNQ